MLGLPHMPIPHSSLRPSSSLCALIRQGSESAPGWGREEGREHIARHIEAGWKLAFYSTNATATGTVRFHLVGPIFEVDGYTVAVVG